MKKSLQEIAGLVLRMLATLPRDTTGRSQANGKIIAEATELSPAEINDAVAILVDSGYAESSKTLGTAPYLFNSVCITPAGRYEYERLLSINNDINSKETNGKKIVKNKVSLPPIPVGSPFGFTDMDWEFIAKKKAQSDQLSVVLGCQFESKFYNLLELKKNVESMFVKAVRKYGSMPTALPITLNFRALTAGYGEHLFNEIARDIISADIAIFETSDLNPNVMLEVGVALTWDIRVLLIKKEGRAVPPSDISGQTWADYNNNAAEFLDTEHHEKLLRMVERAIRKKSQN